mgnify:CR=1 FL=1
MKKTFTFITLLLTAAVSYAQPQLNKSNIDEVIGAMTLEEKVGMTTAQSKFSSRGVPRLGIPEVWHTDGPHGIRPEVLWDEWDQAGWTNDSCTAFPALINLAATWDKEMSLLYGRSIGEEARYRKKDILLVFLDSAVAVVFAWHREFDGVESVALHVAQTSAAIVASNTCFAHKHPSVVADVEESWECVAMSVL